MQIRKLRLLRIKHNIQLEELGAAAGMSKQRVSQIELGEEISSKMVEKRISDAFFEVIAKKFIELSALETDYLEHKDSLFHFVEDDYEL